jgi:tRNA A37 threonylcarbamoyladenosine biosynthesis protein TsaE
MLRLLSRPIKQFGRRTFCVAGAAEASLGNPANPANPANPILLTTEEELTNQGKVTGQYLRKLFHETPSTTACHHANCILLTGHVGAGKTTFARGLIRELSPQSAEEDIPSPTFCLDFHYPIDDVHGNDYGTNNQGVQSSMPLSSRFPRGVHHLDLYRLTGTDPGELQALEFSTLAKEAIAIVEWPDRLTSRNITLEGALWVDIQLLSNTNEPETFEEVLTEEMFEQWVSVPRQITYRCGSPWSTYVP